MTDYLEFYSKSMLPAVESHLRKNVNNIDSQNCTDLTHMLSYHLGWEIPQYSAGKSGKRIRPLLLLLTVVAAHGNWELGLPAASAVELVHNFSLIHDDIQDNSDLRRGRPTVWKIWGIPQAINAGDAMYSLAHLVTHELTGEHSINLSYDISKIISQTCLKLTQGQFLDIAFEHNPRISLESYWHMITLKTAALFSASTQVGAMIAGGNNKIVENYKNFGYELGLAFQVEDDILGIWGKNNLTGKPSASDIIQGKLSLPIIYGLAQQGSFAERWQEGPITVDEIDDVIIQLEQEGAKNYCLQQSERLTNKALDYLESTNPKTEGFAAIKTLTSQLLKRSN